MRTWSFVCSIPLALVLQLAALQPTMAQPPSEKEGWIPLFNGKDLSGWKLRTPDGQNGWTVVGGEYVNTPPSTDIITEREFYDFELHVEFKVSEKTNSGLYLRDKYEVQILNSHGKPVTDNASGALYRRTAPAMNAARPAGEWQTCEITFVGRRLTVVYNGQTVLDGVDVGPNGTGAASDRADGPGPLRLQGDHQQVTFRNIWIRPLPRSSND